MKMYYFEMCLTLDNDVFLKMIGSKDIFIRIFQYLHIYLPTVYERAPTFTRLIIVSLVYNVISL